jgi:hypothetical protein
MEGKDREEKEGGRRKNAQKNSFSEGVNMYTLKVTSNW